MDNYVPDLNCLREQGSNLRWTDSPSSRSETPTPLMSRQHYIAAFLRHLQSENPSISTDEIVAHMNYLDIQYELFKIAPTPENSPPMENPSHNTSRASLHQRQLDLSHPVLSLPQTFQTPSVHTGNAPSSTPPPSMPIQILQPSSSLFDMEKTIPILNPDADIPTFLRWQSDVLLVLALIPFFTKEILEEPREHIAFDRSIPEAQISQLYQMVWIRIRCGIRGVCDKSANIANTTQDEVHTLWLELRRFFLPTTQSENMIGLMRLEI